MRDSLRMVGTGRYLAFVRSLELAKVTSRVLTTGRRYTTYYSEPLKLRIHLGSCASEKVTHFTLLRQMPSLMI